MSKTAIFRIDGETTGVVEYDDSRMITFRIGYNPHFEKGDGLEYSIFCDGFEWGEQSYSLEFTKVEIQEGQVVELEFGSTEPATVQATKEIVSGERNCMFCHRPETNVEHLIERSPIARICSDCVKSCMDELGGKGV